MNKSYLPSKKIWILIGVILVIAGGIYIFSGSAGNPSIATQLGSRVTGNDVSDDGYFGLSINTRDNDALEDAGLPRNKTIDAWEDMLPYMASYIATEEEGREISQAQIEEITDRVAENINLDEADLYDRSDLSINNQATFSDIDTYFITFTDINDYYVRKTDIDNELIIFAQASADDQINEGELQDLEIIADNYQALADDLAEMTIPSELAESHLAMVNNYLEIGHATRNMSTMDHDPVRAMLGLDKYNTLINQQQDIGEALGEEIGRQARLLLQSE